MKSLLLIRSRCFVLVVFILISGKLFAQKSDCNLLTDRDTEDGHIKSTRRTAMVEQPDMNFGVILQNYSGNLKMLIDWAFAATRIKQRLIVSTKNTVTFILKNKETVKFEINEPQPGSGARVQSWGNFEVGGMIEVRSGQADTLQKSPINKMLLSFYGLPPDTIKTFPDKDYFINNLPCVR